MPSLPHEGAVTLRGETDSEVARLVRAEALPGAD